VKETGIIMSGSSVVGILEDRKTVTRRLRGLKTINSIPECYNDNYPTKLSDGSWVFWHPARPAPILEKFAQKAYPNGGGIKCPYGDKGDLLYVKETWRYYDWTEDGEPYIQYRADESVRLISHGIPDEWWEKLTDIWSILSDRENFQKHGAARDTKWRSARFMPKWASRLPLVNDGSRPEKLQSITEEDAIREGVCPDDDSPTFCKECHGYGIVGSDCEHSRDCVSCSTGVGRFASLWDSINPRYPWESNPVVWRIEFRRSG